MIRFAALMLVTGAALTAQRPTSTVRAPRVVLVVDAESQQPIADAEVTDLVTKNSAKTSRDGAVGLFVPEFVHADGAVIRIRKLGYDPAGPLSVDPMVDSTIVIAMVRTATKLPTTTTTANYRLDRDAGTRAGITMRCQSALVSCVGEDELANRPADLLSDFVRRSPGVLPGPGEPRMHSVDVGACLPTIYVDGFKWAGRFSGKQMALDQIFVGRDVKTIEIYRAEQPRPLRFSGDPRCGAIVIWTK